VTDLKGLLDVLKQHLGFHCILTRRGHSLDEGDLFGDVPLALSYMPDRSNKSSHYSWRSGRADEAAVIADSHGTGISL
jgi:hypothetical protein